MHFCLYSDDFLEERLLSMFQVLQVPVVPVIMMLVMRNVLRGERQRVWRNLDQGKYMYLIIRHHEFI